MIIIIIYKKYILYSVYIYFPLPRNVVYKLPQLTQQNQCLKLITRSMTLHYQPRNFAIFKAGEPRAACIACVIKFYYNKTLEKLSMRAVYGFKGCFV